MATRGSNRRSPQRTAPIDPEAVDLAEASLARTPLDRQTEIVLRAACDVTRLRIVRALIETPLAASDLARVIERTPSATSQHIRVLRDVDAVEATRSGNIVRYRLTRGATAQLLETFVRSLEALSDR